MLSRRHSPQFGYELSGSSPDQRERLMRDLMKEPPSIGARLLGQLVAVCDMDRVARMEMLRAIRDALGSEL